MAIPSLAERIELAKAKTNKLVDHALDLLTLHEANRIIVYSPQLSQQIPQSYAAHAFNAFQQSQFNFGLIRLCIFWDECQKDDYDMESIPAVVRLLGSPGVIDALQKEAARATPTRVFGMDEHSREDREAIATALQALAESDAVHAGEKAVTGLKTAIRWADRIATSDQLIAVRNHRDKNLAHSLAATRREKRGPVSVAKYGFERPLLWKTIAVVNKLHLGINGAGFTWKDSMRMARDNADALWNGCTFEVLR